MSQTSTKMKKTKPNILTSSFRRTTASVQITGKFFQKIYLAYFEAYG